jgi:hypothetical protein
MLPAHFNPIHQSRIESYKYFILRVLGENCFVLKRIRDTIKTRVRHYPQLTEYVPFTPKKFVGLQDTIHMIIPRPTIFFRTILPLLLACAALSASRPGYADNAKPQPDVIVFSNGDQLTGKLIRAVSGTVTFHSDVIGDINVGWDKIKELLSSQKFVVLQKGVRPTRKTQESSLPVGVLTVENQEVRVDSVGPLGQPIPAKNVDFVIDEPSYEKVVNHEPGILHGWNGGLTAGATLVQATQNSTNFEGAINLVRAIPTVSWINPRNRTSLDFTGTYGKLTQPGTPDVKTVIYHADAERDQYFTPRLYVLAQAAFDHNFSQSLDLQQIYGGGLGITVFKRPKDILDLKATVQYERQSFIDSTSASTPNLIGSTFAATYTRKLTKGILFNQQLAYIPAWNMTHDYSFNEVDSLVLPVYKRLGVQIGTVDSYLNDPAVTTPPTKRNSFQFTTGVTYTFQ